MKILLYFPIYTFFSWLWLPISFLMRFKISFPNTEEQDLSNINPITKEEVDKLNQSLLGEGQDLCKMMCLNYHYSNNKFIWDFICANFMDNTSYKFVRGEGYEDMSFSGDMLSGMLLAITTAIQNKHITDEQYYIIRKTLDNICFNGILPFRQKHDDYSRGWLGLPSFVNGMGMVILSMLMLGYKCSTSTWDKFCYMFCYLLYLTATVPSLLLGTYDRFIWWWKVVMTFDYNTHSDCLVYRANEMLGIPFSRVGLNYLAKHHKYNLEIQALAGYVDREYTLKHLRILLESRGKEYANDKYIKVFNIKEFSIEEFLEKAPISLREETYNWERFGHRGRPNSAKSYFDITGLFTYLNR